MMTVQITVGVGVRRPRGGGGCGGGGGTCVSVNNDEGGLHFVGGPDCRGGNGLQLRHDRAGAALPQLGGAAKLQAGEYGAIGPMTCTQAASHAGTSL